MPLPTNSKQLKFKVSQPSNFSQLVEKCKTTTEAELLMISSNSLNQKELPKWVHYKDILKSLRFFRYLIINSIFQDSEEAEEEGHDEL